MQFYGGILQAVFASFIILDSEPLFPKSFKFKFHKLRRKKKGKKEKILITKNVILLLFSFFYLDKLCSGEILGESKFHLEQKNLQVNEKVREEKVSDGA